MATNRDPFRELSLQEQSHVNSVCDEFEEASNRSEARRSKTF